MCSHLGTEPAVPASLPLARLMQQAAPRKLAPKSPNGKQVTNSRAPRGSQRHTLGSANTTARCGDRSTRPEANPLWETTAAAPAPCRGWAALCKQGARGSQTRIRPGKAEAGGPQAAPRRWAHRGRPGAHRRQEANGKRTRWRVTAPWPCSPTELRARTEGHPPGHVDACVGTRAAGVCPRRGPGRPTPSFTRCPARWLRVCRGPFPGCRTPTRNSALLTPCRPAPSRRRPPLGGPPTRAPGSSSTLRPDPAEAGPTLFLCLPPSNGFPQRPA